MTKPTQTVTNWLTNTNTVSYYFGRGPIETPLIKYAVLAFIIPSFIAFLISGVTTTFAISLFFAGILMSSLITGLHVILFIVSQFYKHGFIKPLKVVGVIISTLSLLALLFIGWFALLFIPTLLVTHITQYVLPQSVTTALTPIAIVLYFAYAIGITIWYYSLFSDEL